MRNADQVGCSLRHLPRASNLRKTKAFGEMACGEGRELQKSIRRCYFRSPSLSVRNPSTIILCFLRRLFLSSSFDGFSSFCFCAVSLCCLHRLIFVTTPSVKDYSHFLFFWISINNFLITLLWKSLKLKIIISMHWDFVVMTSFVLSAFECVLCY